MSYEDDTNIDYRLPSIKGSSATEALDRKLEVELFFFHAFLNVTESYNNCNSAVVLTSGADGRGNFDWDSSLKHYRAGKGLVGNLGKVGLSDIQLVADTLKIDLTKVIQDKSVGSIFLLGHSSLHSQMATDGFVNWNDAGRMVKDHLKNGIFANLG